MFAAFILGTFLLASGTSGPVSDNANSATTPPATIKAKKICRSADTTGSRIEGKRCKTQEEWDKLENSSEAGSKSRSGMTLSPER